MARGGRARFKVGDTVTGWSYVEPEDRRRETPEEIAGRVVQVGSGWKGVEADQAYLWIRLPSGREARALIRDVVKVTEHPPRG